MPLTMIRAMAHIPCTGPENSTGFADVDTAIASFQEALRTVHQEQRQLRDGDNVLPLMVAPEWCFRKTTGSYFQYDELHAIIEKLLETSKNYPDTLIVPGSILWSMPGSEYVETAKKTLFRKAQGFYRKYQTVYNTAIVINDGRLIHINHKQWEGYDVGQAPLDHFFGLQPGASGRKEFGNNEFWKAWNQKIRAVDESGNGIKSLLSSYFEFKGLKFGIEICADHTSNILSSELGEQQRVDVQLVISCGAEIVPKALATCEGGWVINSDGRWVDKDWQRVHGLTCVRVASYESGKGRTVPNVLTEKAQAYSTAGKSFWGAGQGLVVIWNELLILPRR